jgi:hypothetical protein
MRTPLANRPDAASHRGDEAVDELLPHHVVGGNAMGDAAQAAIEGALKFALRWRKTGVPTVMTQRTGGSPPSRS